MAFPTGGHTTTTTTARFSLFVCWLATVTATSEASFVSYPLVPNHVQRMRRERGRDLASKESGIRRRDKALEVGALYQGYGTHYIDLWCGSPPQRQTVIVDTGSSVTAFPCKGCKDCGVPSYHVDRLFEYDESSTFESNTCADGCLSERTHCTMDQCTISMSYAEGSRWTAFEARDTCYVGGPHETPLVNDNNGESIDPNHASRLAFKLTFGCQTMVTGLFKTQLADGIMGMDPKQEAFWGQMYRSGKMGDKQQFALCFARQPTAERKGTEAGAMTLGGADTRLHKSEMVYTSLSSGRGGFWNVGVRRIALRAGQYGESASSSGPDPLAGVTFLDLPDNVINSGGIIVDSGTTDTYWNRGIASAFQQVFQQVSGGKRHSNSAMSLTPDELKALPTIIFQLKTVSDSNPDKESTMTDGMAGAFDPEHPTDVLLAFPPSHYMEYDPDTGKYTSRFYPTEGSGSVLGANAMMGHDVLFDQDNGLIGWAESDCDYTNLVESGGYKFEVTGELKEPGIPDDAQMPDNMVDNEPETPTEIPPPVDDLMPTGGQLPMGGDMPGGMPGGASVPPIDTYPPLVATDPPIAPVAPPTDPPVAPVAPPTNPPVAPVAPLTEPPVTEIFPTNPTVSGVGGDDEDEEARGLWGKIQSTAVGIYKDILEAFHKFWEVCDTKECRYPVGIGIGLSIIFGFCCSYCASCFCCCRRRSDTQGKYQQASLNEFEMVGTYHDEPGNTSNGTGFSDEPASAMNFRMKPEQSRRKKPEFDGDFL